MKSSDRVKFLKLRRRADALELRALDAEQRCRDLATRLRSAESQIETAATTNATFGLFSPGIRIAPGGTGGIVTPGGSGVRTEAERRGDVWPGQQ